MGEAAREKAPVTPGSGKEAELHKAVGSAQPPRPQLLASRNLVGWIPKAVLPPGCITEASKANRKTH